MVLTFKRIPKLPETVNHIKVLAVIEWLSMTASEYSYFEVLTYCPKKRYFFKYENGDIVKYNDKVKPPGSAIVTKWAMLPDSTECIDFAEYCLKYGLSEYGVLNKDVLSCNHHFDNVIHCEENIYYCNRCETYIYK